MKSKNKNKEAGKAIVASLFAAILVFSMFAGMASANNEEQADAKPFRMGTQIENKTLSGKFKFRAL